jgi:broad specificity phosphatase PhoE
MRIGLLRHFQVTEQFPAGWKTAADLQAWIERYDVAEATVGEFDLGGVEWQACLASDMPRTRITASAVFPGEIGHSELLREASFAPFNTGDLRLPVWVWKWMLRLSWMTGHRSQRGCRDEFRRRVAAAADRLCEVRQDTLVVSHAGMMAYLSAELRRRGFAGPKLRIAKYAKVYVYETHGG